MKIEDIIRLKQEGFAKEDILALAPFIDKEEKQELKSGVVPTADVNEMKVSVVTKEDLNNVMDKLNGLTDLIHTSNIRQNSTAEEPKTAEDVIAEIINPTYKKK